MSTCKVCAVEYTKARIEQMVCSPRCAGRIPVIARNTLKAERKATKVALQKLKTRSQWMREAQKEFNAYIRARDAQEACISCCRHHPGQWHAGHYLSTGARPELRFDEANVHKQCQPCNVHLHGNLVLYRVGLIGKIGAAAVALLEAAHEPKHYSTADLKAIRDEYRRKAKELHAS